MPMFKYASILNKSLFDEICEPVIVFGPDRRLVFLNLAAKKMFGKKVDKTAGVSCARLFGCAPVGGAGKCPFKSFSSSLVKKVVFKIPAGSSPFIEKELAGTAFPVYGNDKTPHGAAFVVKKFKMKNEIDTFRKRADEALKASEERYRTVADFTYDWEYWISPEGGMRYVSPSCERISGYPSSEFICDSGLFEKIMHPGDRKRAVSLMREASETSAVCETDFRIIRSDGDIRWLHHISQPVYSKNGNYLGRRASNRDITSRKKTDRELEESRKKLIEQNIELERKNIALKEVLGRIELEKKEVQDNVMLNVENVLLPILNDLASASSGREKNNIELIKKNIGELTSAFGSRITVKSLKLTPKEIRICNMIKNGMNSKEISETLKISIRTAETHRNNIRKKLGIARAGVNLVTYLQNYFSL